MIKISRRGTGWPAAFEHPLDRKDPYKRYLAPNSGESPKLTMLGNQGVPGEPPDASGSIGGSSKYDHFAISPHPWADQDPDDPFGSFFERDNGVLPYGESGQENNFTHDDNPLSRRNRVFSLISDDKDRKPNQLSGDLSKKRI
jgi:hypothetical protein